MGKIVGLRQRLNVSRDYATLSPPRLCSCFTFIIGFVRNSRSGRGLQVEEGMTAEFPAAPKATLRRVEIKLVWNGLRSIAGYSAQEDEKSIWNENECMYLKAAYTAITLLTSQVGQLAAWIVWQSAKKNYSHLRAFINSLKSGGSIRSIIYGSKHLIMEFKIKCNRQKKN